METAAPDIAAPAVDPAAALAVIRDQVRYARRSGAIRVRDDPAELLGIGKVAARR